MHSLAVHPQCRPETNTLVFRHTSTPDQLQRIMRIHCKHSIGMSLQCLPYQTTLQIIQVDHTILRAANDTLSFWIGREECREDTVFGIHVAGIGLGAFPTPRLWSAIAM
jgi:hypothetical protein